MRDKQPSVETMKASEVRQQFAGILNRVYRQEARIVVERSGIPIAAIVTAEDLVRLDELDAEARVAREVLAAMRKPFRGGPVDEIEKETDRIVAEVRVEDRSSRQKAAGA